MNELQFLIYNTPEENISINAVIKDETIWLTQKAKTEYDAFNKTQKINSDFEKEIKKLLEKGGEIQ